MTESRRTELIVALDVDNLQQAENLLQSLNGLVSWFKVGKQLFTRTGPRAVECIRSYGANTFLDLKFHDIPNTVHQAIRSAAHIGADMINVHASGGAEMLRAAARAGKEENILVTAVTVLTSLDADGLQEVGISRTPHDQVLELARLAEQCELNGVVCSPRELRDLRAVCSDDFLLITPGVRPSPAAKDDQKRVTTPREAAAAGSDYIVVGRPVTAAGDPAQAAEDILTEIKDLK